MQVSHSIRRAGVATLGLAGLIGAAQAQPGPPGGGAQTTSIQLYGTIDVAVGQLASQPPGAPNAPITKITGVHNGGATTSFWGFRGQEALGGGLLAKFQLESFVRVDTGAPGRFNPPGPAQDPFFSRSAWVGLQGSFGELRLGVNTNPAWLSNVFSSSMGSNSLFSPSFRQQYNGSTRGYMNLDTGLPNSISYSTPNMGGVMGTLVVQAKEASPGGNNYSGNLVYRGGPAMLTAAFTNSKHVPPPDAAAAWDESMYLLGGSYDFKVVKLFGQYTNHEETIAGVTTDRKTPHLGLTAPLGGGELQLAWARQKTSTGAVSNTRTTTSLGYIYNLSRRTHLYGMVASDRVPVVGTANSYIVGVRHSF
jgi:predicted porin